MDLDNMKLSSEEAKIATTDKHTSTKLPRISISSATVVTTLSTTLSSSSTTLASPSPIFKVPTPLNTKKRCSSSIVTPGKDPLKWPRIAGIDDEVDLKIETSTPSAKPCDPRTQQKVQDFFEKMESYFKNKLNLNF